MATEHVQVDDFTINFIVQINCVIQTTAQRTHDDMTADRQIAAQATRAEMQFGLDERSKVIEAAQLFRDVEQALRHFHNTAQLAKNPLVRLVNRMRLLPADATHVQTPGLALKRVLDDVITSVSGVEANQALAPSQWRLDHYLHLRYRNGIQHKDLAVHLGYTERHLLRLRRELILEVAALILAQHS